MDEAETEVGRHGAALRLWVAAEAVRHGEMMLAGDKESIAALEARATAMLGWASAAAAALGVWAGNAQPWAPVLWALLPLGAAACLAIVVLWPGQWYYAGYGYQVLTARGFATELAHQEATAFGYDDAHAKNLKRLRRKAAALRGAWAALAIAGGVAVAASWPAPQVRAVPAVVAQ